MPAFRADNSTPPGGGRSGATTSSSYLSNGSSRADIEIIFVNADKKNYECPVCCQVLRYPVQFEECGHRCCSSCLSELIRVAPRCPMDQARIDRDRVYVDRAFQQELDALKVKCPNVSRKCEWEGQYREMAIHLEKCSYSTIQCPNHCGAEFEKRFLDGHLKQDCSRRSLRCKHCEIKLRAEEEETHLEYCPKLPVPCPNKCKVKEVPKSDLQKHLDEVCNRQHIKCPFAEAGCDYECARKHMDNHIKEEPEVHLNYVSAMLANYKGILSTHSQILEENTTILKDVEGRVENLEKLYGAQMVWKIPNYETKLQEAKDGVKPTIFSPPFLTSRHGYKLAMSACLYGDGKARGKFMSLFLCICKSEYDPLLVWPFCHRVHFTLIDQCQDPAGRRNITYTVKPNTCKDNRVFLGRPEGDRNPSFGAQRFCELTALKTMDYIRDDTMYVKVHVETDDMILV